MCCSLLCGSLRGLSCRTSKKEISPFIRFKPKVETSKTPFVFLHGILGNKSNFRAIGQALSDRCGYEGYSLDIRHHGDWGYCPEFNYHDLAEDVRNFAEHECRDRIHLVGHSFGGKIAMVVSALYPKLLQSLTVVDIAPRKMQKVHDVRRYLEAVFSIDLSSTTSKSEVYEQLLQKLNDKSICDLLMMNLHFDRVSSKLRWSYTEATFMRSLEHAEEFPDLAFVYKGPTKFILGGKSDFTSAADHTVILAKFPQAEIEVVEGAGHVVHLDQQAKFISIMKDIIGNCD